jgi:hypothetical protein
MKEMPNDVMHSQDIDRLGEALITLAKELWIVKDRQRVLEAALVDAGFLDPSAVDTYQPDEALTNQLEGERKKLIDDLIDVLVTPPLEKPHR